MFENRRPESTPEHLRWTRVAIDPGKSIKGWTAGPVFGCEGHHNGAFKPCRAVLTKGKLPCPYCAIPLALRFQGYMPVFDSQLKRLVVVVNLDNTVRVDSMKHLAPVELVKGKYVTAPVEVRSNEWTTLKPTGRTISSVPQDIREWLFRVLWKAEGLAEWYDAHRTAEVAAPPAVIDVNPEPTPEVVEPDITEELRQKLHDRGFKKAALFFTSEKKASKNGKHEGNGKPPTKPR